MKVLIVDEDGPFRENLRLQLEKSGARALATDDADEGRVTACQERVDVILLGAEAWDRALATFIRMVRAECPWAEVILVNHAGDVHTSMEAMKLGAFDEIGAPVDMVKLMKKLENAVGSRGGAARRTH